MVFPDDPHALLSSMAHIICRSRFFPLLSRRDRPLQIIGTHMGSLPIAQDGRPFPVFGKEATIRLSNDHPVNNGG